MTEQAATPEPTMNEAGQPLWFDKLNIETNEVAEKWIKRFTRDQLHSQHEGVVVYLGVLKAAAQMLGFNMAAVTKAQGFEQPQPEQIENIKRVMLSFIDQNYHSGIEFHKTMPVAPEKPRLDLSEVRRG